MCFDSLFLLLNCLMVKRAVRNASWTETYVDRSRNVMTDDTRVFRKSHWHALPVQFLENRRSPWGLMCSMNIWTTGVCIHCMVSCVIMCLYTFRPTSETIQAKMDVWQESQVFKQENKVVGKDIKLTNLFSLCKNKHKVCLSTPDPIKGDMFSLIASGVWLLHLDRHLVAGWGIGHKPRPLLVSGWDN